MMKFIVLLCSIFPPLRRQAWKWWYEKLARQIPADRWTFMNYGYVPEENSTPLLLDPEDEPDRHFIQLYERVISPTQLSGKTVLEVGSGRGGGMSYIARYHHPEKVIGMDFSPEAIIFSKKRHADVEHTEFLAGDAEQIPFPDHSFDIILNVESSHCYGNVEKFITEASRLLRPGGWFLFADMRTPTEMSELRKLLEAQPSWKKIEEEDISMQVLAALKADTALKESFMEASVPVSMRSWFSEFAGKPQGIVFNNLQKRDLLYYRFAFKVQK